MKRAYFGGPEPRAGFRANAARRVLAVLTLVAAPALAAATSEWTPVTTAMAARRHAPTATMLTAGASTINGRVLVAGGYTGSGCTNSAQLFDPTTKTWSTTGALMLGRAFHTATDLGDGTGRILVAGGFSSSSGYWKTETSVEIYNPSAGTFSYPMGYMTRQVYDKRTRKYVPTNVANQQQVMSSPRELFTATRLPTGKILLVGGINGGQTTVKTAELFDPLYDPNNPTSRAFTYTGSMQTASGRFGHDAVLIPPAPEGSQYYDPADQGKVLVVGGKEHAPDGWHSLGTAELYDVATGTFTSIPIIHSRDRPRVAWVPSVGAPDVVGPTGTRGMVLVVGGKFDDNRISSGTHDVLESEWFDPTTSTFSEGPRLTQGRMAHTLTALEDGSLLAAGGWSDTLGRSTETAERFVPNSDPLDPFHGTFFSAGSMADQRQDQDAAALPGNRVLVVGGKPNVAGQDRYLSSAEYYTRP